MSAFAGYIQRSDDIIDVLSALIPARIFQTAAIRLSFGYQVVKNRQDIP
jgi:hypothetical protein